MVKTIQMTSYQEPPRGLGRYFAGSKMATMPMVKAIQMTSPPEPPGILGLYFAGSIWGTSLYKIAENVPVGL